MNTSNETYRLLRSAVVTLLAVLATTMLLIQSVTVTGHDYFSTFDIKHERLSALSGPKVIIVGGSNTTFGYASEEFEKELGMPAVNMGLHANFGLRFMLSEVRDEIDPGDIVLLSPEYEQFTRDYLDGDLVLGELVLTNIHALQFIERPEQFLQLLFAVPATAQKAVISNLHPDRELDPMYLASAFNRYGDIEISSRVSGLQFHSIPRYSEDDINPSALELIEAFSNEASERGATVLLTYPSVPVSMYTINREFLAALDLQLRMVNRLHVVNTPGMRVHPDTHCYDTHYHLRTKQMRKISTGNVIHSIISLTSLNALADLTPSWSLNAIRIPTGKP